MRVLVYGMVGTNRGGIETFLKKMNSFMSRDVIFDYVIEENQCIHENEIREKGGRIFYITSRKKNPIKNIIDNYKLLKKCKEDVGVVYFNLSSLSWIAPIKEAVSLGYRVCVHSHNAQFIDANGGVIYRIVNKINKFRLSKMNITRLTCSRPATEFMFGKSSNVEMIYNAINTDQFKFNAETRNKVRKQYDIVDDFVIGFVGRIANQKNPLFIPEIALETVKKIKNCKFLVVGDGDLKENLKKEINKRLLDDCFVLTGNVTNVNELLHAMDVFILPSNHEGLPYVVIEAQTAGLHCVLSDVITKEVDATGNVTYLPINEGASCWADELSRIHDLPSFDRCKIGSDMETSVFNINTEAKHLEKVLKGK